METPTLYRACPTAAHQEVDGEVFVVTPGNELHNLRDPVAVHLWRALVDGPVSLEALVDGVVAEFEVDRETARRDIAEFLDVAVARGLVEGRSA